MKFVKKTDADWHVERLPSGLNITGSSEFYVTKSDLHIARHGPLDAQLLQILQSAMHGSRLSQRTILDLCNEAPYFAISSLQRGAKNVFAVNGNHSYLKALAETFDHLGCHSVLQTSSALNDLPEALDVVVALDHKLWPDNFDGDIAKSIAELSRLAKYMVLFALPVVYQLEMRSQSEQALSRHFRRWSILAEMHDAVYVIAFTERQEIDLRCPLPVVSNDLKIVNCKLLCTVEGVDYWSRVYEDGDSFKKQFSQDLAKREYLMINKLNSIYFPKALALEQFDGYSLVTLKRLHGSNLSEHPELVNTTRAKFIAFMKDCLEILRQLQAVGIEHRDISAANMIVCDGKPVLIDFSWAVTAEWPLFTPPGLTPLNLDSQVSDIVSMGMTFYKVAGQRYEDLCHFFDLMMDLDPDLRMSSAEDLARLLDYFVDEDNTRFWTPDSNIVSKLLKNTIMNRRRWRASEEAQRQLSREHASSRDYRLVVFEKEYKKVCDEVARLTSEVTRITAEKDVMVQRFNDSQAEVHSYATSKVWKLTTLLQKFRLGGNLPRC